METPNEKSRHSTKKSSSFSSSKFSQIKKWVNTPFGIIAITGIIILTIEVFVLEFLFSFVSPTTRAYLPDAAWELIDAIALTLAVSPALYFLIFRRVSTDAEKFLKITSAAQDAVIVMGDNNEIVFWNISAERIFGYTKEEALGQNLHQLVAPQKSLNAFESNVEHFHKTGQGPILERVREVTAKRKGGEEFPAELSVAPLFINDKWSAVGIVRDITERKKHEEELALTNKKLIGEKARDEAILESLGEGLIATDKLGNIITVNHTAERMVGWKEGELLGKKILDAIRAVDEKGDAIPKEQRPAFITLSTGVASTSEKLNLLIKNDGTVPVAATATPIKIGDEILGAVLIFRDITKEQELEVTRRDLLSLASHQLRTPLSGTKWLIETLQNKLLGPLNEKQGEYLAQIYKINEGMTELVHDMLGVLRMEGDITETKKEDVSLVTLFGVISETLGSAAKSKNITLRLDIGDEHKIKTDPLLLRQVLESLVSNAINYSPAGSEVLTTIKQSDLETVIIIKDSGIGIPADEQRQIFQRFYRATNAKTYDTKGTGLGLYIAATLTKKIGGHISFESEEGKGTKFYVRIPLSQE